MVEKRIWVGDKMLDFFFTNEQFTDNYT